MDMTVAVDRRLRNRLFRLDPFRSFAIVGLAGMLAIVGASVFASQKAGEAEAMSDMRRLTEIVAKTVVAPNLSAELLAGDPAAIEQLDRIVSTQVLDDVTLTVKLWDSSGRIVYSDQAPLIGETYELDEQERDSFRSGEVKSEISALQGPDDRFMTEFDELLEVYLPIDGPDGRPLLYESYFATSGVSTSVNRIRAEFLPIIIAALALMEAMHVALAWGMSKRMRRNQQERERLLQRAIDSSEIERRRIAADIHDGVVQEMVGTSFAVAAAAQTAEDYDSELADDLRTAAIGTRRSLQSLRSLLVDIYPPKLLEDGLEAALIDLLAPATSRGLETDLAITGDPDSTPDAVTLIYRVVQEAVRNVLRHAEATSLNIDILATSASIKVMIGDDGVGFAAADVSQNGHLGLRLMADLTADAGAEFSVDSTPGGGTTIRVEVPR